MKAALAALLLAAAPATPAAPAAPDAPTRAPAAGSRAMVATAQRDATQAGVDVLRAGGNAVDAAVAVGYALAVTDPCCGNIGGGGFAVLRMRDGNERFVDFREKAPLRATRDMYLDGAGNPVAARSQKGWLAIGVPGTVLGLETLRRQYGTMPRAALMAPAIRLASDGFTLTPWDVTAFGGAHPIGENASAIFEVDGRAAQPGDLWRQPLLARTLETISAGGADAFYRGPIARAIVAASDANGGLLSMQDFAGYSVEEAAPLRCRFHGYDLASAAPPSAGGVTLCEILNIVAPLPLASWGRQSVQSLHYLTEAERRAYADRNAYIGDPDFVKNPVAELLSPQYAATLRAQIQPDRATPSSQVRPGLSALAPEAPQTTHYSIVDRWGNAIAVTYTLNAGFGASVVAGDTGFLLNDEMDDFSAKPGAANLYGLTQGQANAVAPGKRPLSSMAPTIVTKNGRLVMVTGSPGGGRIITIVLGSLLDVLLYGMNVQAAVDAPRTHMQWLPDKLYYEAGAMDDATQSALAAMGYDTVQQKAWGSAQAVFVDPVSGVRYGGSDHRTPDGFALGY